MYFIEVIAKKIFNKKNKEEEVIPSFEQQDERTETCKEHTFLPVDSTGEVLSCINCGLIVHKSDLHRDNPF